MVSALETVLARGENVRKTGSGWLVSCPLPEHGKGRGDENPSVGVDQNERGDVLVNCYAGCATEAVVAEWGLKMSDLFEQNGDHNGYNKPRREPTATWHIKDANGEVQAVHVRFDESGEKECLWRLPEERGWGLKGRKLSTLPLYRSEHLKDWPDEVPVIVVEGEKAADALARVYPPVLGTVTGAGNTPGPEALEVLRDRRVILWPDNDDEGRRHMARIAEALCKG
jgi:hypothetical protein